MTPEEAKRRGNLKWDPVLGYFDSILGVWWPPSTPDSSVWYARNEAALAGTIDAKKSVLDTLTLERDAELRRVRREYGVPEGEAAPPEIDKLIRDRMVPFNSRVAAAEEGLSGAVVSHSKGTKPDDTKRIPNVQRGNWVFRVNPDGTETPLFEVPRAPSEAAGRYDTPMDIARQALAEREAKREAEEYEKTQEFDKAKFAAEQSLARDRLKWDEANALARREADVYGNLLTSFSQMTPYALPAGVEYTPGFEPGGPAQYLSGKMNLPYNPESFRSVMKYSPEDIWAMSRGLAGKQEV